MIKNLNVPAAVSRGFFCAGNFGGNMKNNSVSIAPLEDTHIA